MNNIRRLLGTSLLVAAGASTGVYIALTVGFAIWAQSCWDCVEGSGDRRSAVLMGVALYYGPIYWIGSFGPAFILAVLIQTLWRSAPGRWLRGR